MNERIYLDNNATTGVDPLVAQAMLQELSTTPANPSSTHYFGQEARQRLLRARSTIANFLRVKPHEIIFTSGGTESMNLLLHGQLSLHNDGHVITSSIEHSCVFGTLKAYEKKGFKVSFLSPGLLGAVPLDAIEAAIAPNTRLIALSAANNETGVKHDLAAIGQIAERAHIPLIVDGVALLGKEDFSIPKGVSAIGFSAHKFHGPKGVGFAYIRSQLRMNPLLIGGDQEGGKRAGTENLPGIIGMAKAIELLQQQLPEASQRMRELRDRLEILLCEQLDPVIINGQGPRVANTSNLSFPSLHGEDLLMALDLAKIAVSHGSACSSGALEPSRVLLNMGIPTAMARSAIRFSLSRWTTVEEIDRCVEVVVSIVKKLRAL